MKTDDEIMAEYLLKGGKMLANACPSCGQPLFEINGETVCVICKDKKQENQGQIPQNKTSQDKPDLIIDKPKKEEISAPQGLIAENIRTELERTIMNLCRKAQNNNRPDECLILMESIEKGIQALALLR